jgi:hypothetical protein
MSERLFQLRASVNYGAILLSFYFFSARPKMSFLMIVRPIYINLDPRAALILIFLLFLQRARSVFLLFCLSSFFSLARILNGHLALPDALKLGQFLGSIDLVSHPGSTRKDLRMSGATTRHYILSLFSSHNTSDA